MSNPMLPERLESSSSSRRRDLKRRERKMWKKPISISRLPSFGFSGSDFAVDQIPTIFSGYTAESEDFSSSSSDMSDDSTTHSKSSLVNLEIDQEKSKSVRRRATLKSLSSMKVLRRQSTRKVSLGAGHRLKKMRSLKRLTSNSRHKLRKKNLDSISSDGLGLLQPHYLRPTSSSASKIVVENSQKDLGVARLKRISSLRYNGLLKATCSSAMKGSSSKKNYDICNYKYCSMHGQPHSHAEDNSVTVPSLKRFVSMRRKFLKRQKSVNRRLVLLKRTLSRKRGPLGGRVVTDQETNQVDHDDDNEDGESNQDGFKEEVSSLEKAENDSESNEITSEPLMVDLDDTKDGGMDSWETVASDGSECVQESKPEIMDDSDLEKSAEHGMVEGTQCEETMGDDEKVCRESSSEEMREDDRKKTENVWNDKESKPEFMDDSNGSVDKDSDNDKVERTKREETVEDTEDVYKEKEEKNTENVWNDTVALVKQAFDEILAEITDDDSSVDNSFTKDETLDVVLVIEDDDVGTDSSDSTSSDTQPIKGRDTHLSVIVSTSHTGEESNQRRGLKKWTYLKRVILLKSFLKSLDRRKKRKVSDVEDCETIMRLRRELIGERKNAEEWMLDHALRQVILTLAPSQKKKVKHLVKAFESLIPVDDGSRSINDHGSHGREENEIVNSQMILRDVEDNTDTRKVSSGKDIEEVKVTSEVSSSSSSLFIGMESCEALESKEDASSSQYLAAEEELDVLAMKEDATSSQDLAVEEELDGLAMKEDASSNQDLAVEEELDGLAMKEDASSNQDLALEEELDALAIKKNATSSKDLAVEEDFDGVAIKEERTRDSEEQNLSTWRNLIQKNMVTRVNSERNRDHIEKEHKWSYGIEEDGDAAERRSLAVESFQKAFETILSEIPDPSFDDEETVSESSNRSVKEEKQDQGETKKRWNSLRKVILLKRFVKSLDNVQVLNPRKLRSLPVESGLEAENVLLRHRSTMERRRIDGEELMLDYALRQAISRLAPIQRKKVELLVQAFDTVLDGHENPKQTKTSDTPMNNDELGKERTQRVEEDCEVHKDEVGIKSVFSRFQVHQKDLKGEEEFDSTPKESRNLLPPISNVKQRIVVEKEKDSRLWKLIYKHMVTEKEETDSTKGESMASVERECDDEAGDLQIEERRSSTVTLVREALEKILSEIPDNSSDDQSVDSDITTEQELFERKSEVSEEPLTFKPKSSEKRVKGWNNVKKVILLKRFVSDLGSLTRLSPKTPRVLPWEPDPETEKISLRHQEVGGKRNSEEWMLDYALRQAISTLAPSQKRKVTLLAQAFDTISLQDIGSGSTPGSASRSRNISRQSSISSMALHSENESNAEIIRGRLMNLQEDLKKATKPDLVANDSEEKQQCSSLWRLLCKQMEDNERSQTLPEETKSEEEEESKEDTNVDGEKMEVYQTEAVDLLGEVIDGISLEESQDQNLTRQKVETTKVSQVKINRWSNLKRVILLRRFVKALENVRKFNPKEPRFLPLDPAIEAEKVNLRHQETQSKRNGDEWMVDNALQGVVSKLTPARKLKVQLLVQAFESLSATGN